MPDLAELYQQVILDHNRNPRNFKTVPHANRTAHGDNPLCGDKIRLEVALDGDTITDVGFQGSGCAISQASASLLTTVVKGKTVDDAEALFRAFHAMVMGTGGAAPGKLAVFAGVALPWFLAVSHRIPEFPHYVFVRETFERVTTTRFHRTAPFWYYLPILPVAAFPWTVPALAWLTNWRWAWLARRVNPQAQDAMLLTCWVLAPLLFFTLNQSKLPQYVLPVMPPFALAAARLLTRQASALGGGIGVGSRTYGAIAALLGALLVSLTLWLPAPISLTPAERAAIPPTALALGIVLIASALMVSFAGRPERPRPALAIMGYVLPVMVVPLVSGRLLDAGGDDRSAVTLARVIHNTGSPDTEVIGVSAFPPSLPFYLRRTIPLAKAPGRHLTSNLIADSHERLRTVPGSPLKPPDYWRERVTTCRTPTVVVTRTGLTAVRASLDSLLPLLAVEGRYAAYGPCAASSAR